jgi:hypothetical protein
MKLFALLKPPRALSFTDGPSLSFEKLLNKKQCKKVCPRGA